MDVPKSKLKVHPCQMNWAASALEYILDFCVVCDSWAPADVAYVSVPKNRHVAAISNDA